MSFFNLLGKLKNIFRGNIHIHDLLHHVININHIHIEQHSPPDAAPINEIAPGRLILNLDKLELSPAQREAIKAAFHEAVLIDDIPLLEDKSKERLEDIAVSESDSEIKILLKFFKKIIPAEDYAALRSAIYIKNKFDERAPQNEILSLKKEVREKFGLRGNKISNLWSSGYFKDMIKPIYDRLSSDPDFSENDFLKYYDLIIDEEAFAVFVPSTMTAEQLISIIRQKIKSNLRYGVYFITIHGIGKECVDTINGIIPDIETNYDVINRAITEKNYIIRAKFWFRK